MSTQLMKFLNVGDSSFEVCDAAARAGIGSPLMAATAADMTDTTKVYVYVGSETGYVNGDWYYYDGSTWQDGGVYNSAAIQLDTTLTQAGEAADAKAVGDALADKANVDGLYENMTVGNAEQLVATVNKIDKTPYLFRTSGGSLDIGDREVDKLVGGTVAWNQLVDIPSTNKSLTANNVTIVDNRDGTYTVSTTAEGASADTYIEAGNFAKYANHIYFLSGCPTGGSSSTYFWYVSGINASNKDIGNGKIVSVSENGLGYVVPVYVKSGTIITTPIVFKPICIDLTQMFGSTIADYIYSLETSTLGSGVAFFRKLFPDDYYAYNAGELMSVKTSAHVMVGFNQWDEEWEVGTYNESTGEKSIYASTIRNKNKIQVLPNTTYYIKTPDSIRILTYDEDENYIDAQSLASNHLITFGANVRYMNFRTVTAYGTTYNHDICINLHWDGERDGEYEAYKKYSYALDPDLELRGIPKLDASNNLYYDGDTYESDGTVTRKYKIVDMGNLEWKYTSSTTRFYTDDITDISLDADFTDMVCSNYDVVSSANSFGNMPDKSIKRGVSNAQISIRDLDYTDASLFTTAVTGKKLVYEVATPTTETADTYQNPQIVDDWGTEEYVDSRSVKIPVGHETEYQPNLRAKLEMSPNLPASSGKYLMNYENGTASYEQFIKELPTLPSEDGTYSLKCTVSGTTKTLTWEADAT